MKKVYVSDLDGTLLGRNSQLSVFSRQQLLRLLSKNFFFSVASARSLVTIKEILGELPFSLPVVELNGACVSDYHTGERFSTQLLPAWLAKELVSELQREKISFITTNYTKKNFDVCLFPKRGNAALEFFYHERVRSADPRVRVTNDMRRALELPLISLTVIDKVAHYQAAVAFFKNKFPNLAIYEMGTDSGGFGWVTFQSGQANKGSGAKVILEQLSAAPSELVVFGDNVNDVPLFEVAEHRVALANSIPPLKEQATEIIGYHYEDSVMHYIANACLH